MADPWANVPVVRSRTDPRQNEREQAETRYRNATGDANPLARPVILPGEADYEGPGDYLPQAGVIVRPWENVPAVPDPTPSEVAAQAKALQMNPDTDAAARENQLQQGFSFGFGDEATGILAGVGQAARNGFNRATGQPIDINSADLRSAVTQRIRQQNEQFQQEHPWQSAGLQLAGGALTGGAGAGRAGLANAVRTGAAYGAAYGAGTAEGGFAERLPGAALNAVVGGATGGLIHAGVRAAAPYAARIGGISTGATPRPVSGRAGDVQTLIDSGVSLTPGQRMGGVVQNVENLAQRAPILGPAIRGARQRGSESLNRAVGLRALDNVGQPLPATTGAGSDMVSYVGSQLGKEFERGYAMVPEFVPDQQLVDGIRTIEQAKADLPPQLGDQFDNILKSRLGRLGTGGASGENVGAIRSELTNLAAGYLKSQDPAQQGLGRMLSGVADELDSAVERISPEAGQVLNNARQGYADYIRLERASTAANGNPFSPGHLSSAVRQSDGSVRRGAVARGEARMQDLSRAASNVMPDTFGNPGTADAIGLGALGTGLVTEPVTTAAVAGGLGVAATPYLMMGRKLVERLPASATPREVSAAIDAVDGAAEALGIESGAALDDAVRLSEQARLSGRPVPRAVRQLVDRARNAFGAQSPAAQQLERLLLPAPVAAEDQQQ